MHQANPSGADAASGIQERAMSSSTHPVPSAVPALRTLALVGAAASGKTTLVEALLHQAGAIGAPGSL